MTPHREAPSGKAPLAITMGDACGIGPEIIAMAFRGEAAAGAFVLGDVDVMRRAVRQTGGLQAVAVIERPADALALPPGCIGVLPVVQLPDSLPQGQIDARAGAAAHDCIRRACELALAGQVAALVTAPIHKEALSAAGIAFPGHTEMLQAYANGPEGPPVRMMLANDELKTVLVTIHMSLRQAIERVDFDNVLQTLRIVHRSARLWGQPAPRIAVAGLNPHAGEGGLFGDEELRVIGPAIEAACAEGIAASGPYAPDTVFMRARNTLDHPGEFDVVVAMYHDQGLIPVKYLGVERGVNVTLGLPFIRTSPDHGTAFDLAGSGRADPSSLVSAIEMARRLAAAA
ncbi:4-hydroxythreonine-4-phosphate dehydrogenase PdxA [Aquabacterium sp. A7-Y]|uniref:4-hydroxythreonine-4-phosphate dehydrogenase PdxA n=1 Tax=Aquabacterium sp. A7-Y TaxID=1349605 RepID=UPI00223CAB81|nr:4-hydroxythreonine-4-phosphate dehydrogenase PdxA [Aquabacterium sp. A7-Y]MCW7537192.1 4-hydroxythreonine-4-phosphate dehydrogenase PdxA [Aquabacterium sp. A7-Y]